MAKKARGSSRDEMCDGVAKAMDWMDECGRFNEEALEGCIDRVIELELTLDLYPYGSKKAIAADGGQAARKALRGRVPGWGGPPRKATKAARA